MHQTSLHGNGQIPSNLEGSTTGVDRKTKKRIQNRVAQRTYRKCWTISRAARLSSYRIGSRIKQRLHDLQQQVHQLQQKEGEQQQNTRPRQNEADGSGNEGATFYSLYNQAPNTASCHPHRRGPSGLEVSCQENISGMSSTDSTTWENAPGHSSVWNSPLGGPSFLYNPLPLRTRPTLDLPLEATIPPLSPSKPTLDHPNNLLCHSSQGGLALSRGDETNTQNQLHNRVENVYGKT